MIYRRRASPLHAVRAAVGCAWCAVLGVAALVCTNPIGLLAVVLALCAAGIAAGCGRSLRGALTFALPIALAITVINALVTRDGLTVIWRFGDLPVLGQTDVTLEATVYGAVLGLRAVALILAGTLYTVAVDPDEVLRLFGRISLRSALSATLATRMVPVLARDSRRLADARRCRPGPAPSRVALLRATAAGLLDRALDVAAALEVRGYGSARRPAPGPRRAWSRPELAFAASAAVILALTVLGRIAGAAAMNAYPRLHVPVTVASLGLAVGVWLAALCPFLVRRGVAG